MKRLMALAIAGLIVMAAALPAAAQAGSVTDQSIPVRDHDPATALDKIKTHAERAIAVRLETLGRLTDAVSSNDHLTGGHAAQLLAELSGAETGLAALGDEIQNATGVEEALGLAAKIATDYRVYLVIGPKTHAVLASDSIVAAEGRFSEAADEVQAAIERAEQAGVDTGDAQALLDEARAAATVAADQAAPVADRVVDLAASDWPDPAEAILLTAREDLPTAGSSLRDAVHRLRAAIDELRSALPAPAA